MKSIALCRSIIVGLVLIGAPAIAAAQSPESEAAPEKGTFEPGSIPAPDRPFLVPDVPASVESATQVKSHWFTLKPGLVLLFDYNVIGQDDRNESYVGPLESQFDVRSARGMLRGTIAPATR